MISLAVSVWNKSIASFYTEFFITDYAKTHTHICRTTKIKAFYRSLNSIFGKVGRSASEEVVLQLVYSKCVPVLLYGSEVCPLTKSDLNSMDFAFIRFTMKLFKTGNIDLYNEICIHFGIDSIENLIADRQNRFIGRYRVTDNCVCQMLCWFCIFCILGIFCRPILLCLFNLCLLYFSLNFFSATIYYGEIKLYNMDLPTLTFTRCSDMMKTCKLLTTKYDKKSFAIITVFFQWSY